MKMDDKKEQSSAIILDDIGETGEQFSGNELDEPEDIIVESSPDTKSAKGAEKRSKRKAFLCLTFAIGLFAFSTIGYHMVRHAITPLPTDKKEVGHLVKFAIERGQSAEFRSFVIPFQGSKKYCYITLSIAFNLPNQKLREKILADGCRLRGIMYDMLSEEMAEYQDIPSPEEIKKCIIRAVNRVLTVGKIDNVYIIDLLAV